MINNSVTQSSILFLSIMIYIT